MLEDAGTVFCISDSVAEGNIDEGSRTRCERTCCTID
jgi:hypothetical protein